MLVTFVTWLLKRKTLSLNERALLTNAILTKLDSISITDIIKVNGDRSISVNGVLLQHEQVAVLREGAKTALNNQALRFVHDQTAYEAIKLGVYTASSPENIIFAKSALWFGTKQRELLVSLATHTTEHDIEQELNPH